MRETAFQHLIFQFLRKKKDKSYEFFPYQYGPYSLTLKDDLERLQGNFPLSRDVHLYDRWGDTFGLPHELDDPDYLLEGDDLALIKQILAGYESQSMEQLIATNILSEPYYAQKCTILEEILPYTQLVKLRPPQRKNFDAYVCYYKPDFSSQEVMLNQFIEKDLQFVLEVQNLKKHHKLARKNWLKKLDIGYLNIWDDHLFSIRDQDQLMANEWEEFSQRLAYLQLRYRRVGCIIDVNKKAKANIEKKVNAWTA